jgi:succinate-semialdehyde dehydrogenase/glutarate-semialdehyde dehydrogenase
MTGSSSTQLAVTRSLTDELTGDITTTGSKTEAVYAPFTGEVLHDLPISTVQDVADAAASARVAQVAWWAAGHAHRRRVLLKAHDLLLERRHQVLDILQTETGKTRGQAFEEVFQGANITRYSALGARRALATKRRRAGIPLVITTKVTYQPRGLVGVITPWNYPVSLSLMDVVPALATGNAVIQKADNQGALSILASRRAFIDAGVPAALWPVVAGPGSEIGSAVIDETDVVCFTGSTPTGKHVGQQAAGNLTYASLELGGKNPMIVLDDVDPVKAAAAAVYACFSSLGQLCVSDERIYVQRAVADEFIAAFVERTRALKQGSALDYSTDVGALTLPSQVERVKEHVDDAVAKGATLLAGGRIRDDLGPNFFEPTVLTGVTPDMACYANETFGPVVSITVVDTEDEAVERANDSVFGLNASVFGGSASRASRVAERVDAGSVNINEGYRASFSSADAPMGGMKQSGLGRRNGPEGFTRFIESRTVARATGLLTLPRTGPEFSRLTGPMLLLLRILKGVRRR